VLAADSISQMAPWTLKIEPHCQARQRMRSKRALTKAR
jgi:hypothetical protein